MIVSVVLNGLQGVFITIVYIVLTKATRTAMKREFTRATLWLDLQKPSPSTSKPRKSITSTVNLTEMMQISSMSAAVNSARKISFSSMVDNVNGLSNNSNNDRDNISSAGSNCVQGVNNQGHNYVVKSPCKTKIIRREEASASK